MSPDEAADILNEMEEETSEEILDEMDSAPKTEVRELLGKQGFDVVAGTPAQFERWIRSESVKWARVIKTSGATAD